MLQLTPPLFELAVPRLPPIQTVLRLASFGSTPIDWSYQHWPPQMFMFVKSFEVVAMVVLGGLGSISGSVVAAIILTFLPEGLRSVKDYMPGGRDPRMVIYSIMLIVLMLTRPQGLLGRRELWQVFGRRKEKDKPQEFNGDETLNRKAPPTL